MKEIAEAGNYETVHLFSDEGLLLAEHYQDRVIDHDRLLELSVLFREVKQMADVMGQISNIKEMIVDGYNHRKIIFRFFRAFEQDVALAVVVPPRKTYRALTNSLVRLVQDIAV
jgi:hypothetical protein